MISLDVSINNPLNASHKTSLQKSIDDELSQWAMNEVASELEQSTTPRRDSSQENTAAQTAIVIVQQESGDETTLLEGVKRNISVGLSEVIKELSEREMDRLMTKINTDYRKFQTLQGVTRK